MKNNRKQKVNKKITFRSLLQALYLTINFTTENDLPVYASACAFGFLFSCFPVITITLHILLRVFHISPDAIAELLNTGDIFTNTFQISRLIESVLSSKKFGIVELLLGLSLLWMARRFFASLMNGVRCIFHEKLQQQPLLFNIIILILEVTMVVFFVVIIIAIFAARSIYNYLPFQKLFPHTVSTLHTLLLSLLPLLIMFTAVTLCYHYTPGTKPNWRLCAFSAAICTLVFTAFLKLFNLFVNMTKYNLVYGVLSNIIVLLLDVFTFFILFLFFLQAIYVVQHFEILLLAQLYLMPAAFSLNPSDKILRLLFIRPDHFIFQNPSLMEFKKKSIIFTEGDKIDSVYFILQGEIRLTHHTQQGFFESTAVRGDFLGEESCLFDEPINESAQAESNVVLIRISNALFRTMLNKNPTANKKALLSLSDYFRSESSSGDKAL